MHAVYKKPYFLLQVTQESVSVLQVTQEFVSGTTSHMRASDHAMKSKVCMIKSLSPSYTGKKYHSFVGVGIATCGAQQYRWQQTCDVFQYSFVLW